MSLPAALTVQPGVAASIVTSLSVPALTRVGRVYSFVVTYKNPSNNDVPAPLLQIQSPNETAHRPGPRCPRTMADYTIQVLGISPDGPAGILRPGQQGTVVVYFQSVEGDNRVHRRGQHHRRHHGGRLQHPEHGAQPGSSFGRPVERDLRELPAGGRSDRGRLCRDARPERHADAAGPGQQHAGDRRGRAPDRPRQAAIGPSITGTLQTTDPQLALGDLPVYATNETTGDVFATTSLNDGSFIFDTVTPGSYDFSVDGALITGTPTATVAAGQAVQGVHNPRVAGGRDRRPGHSPASRARASPGPP